VCLSVLFGGFFLAGQILQPTTPALYTYTRPIILEFLGGVFLAELWLRRWIAGTSLGLACVGSSLAGFAAIHVMGAEFNAGICGPLAMALVYGMVSLEADGSIGRVPVLTYLGGASYSIYLWHTFAVSVVVKVGEAIGLSPVLIAFTAVVSGVILGSIAYEMVEKPLKKLFSRPSSKPATLARRPS
jgi:exopolysaccharide production protein ExoZ